MYIDDVNKAADAYLAESEGAAAARLTFLKGLWALQADLADSAPAYGVPETGAARDALVTGQPLFLVSPPEVPADALRAAIARVVTYILDAQVLDETESKALAGADVPAAITDSMTAAAASNFDESVVAVSAALASCSEDVAPSEATLAFVLHSAVVPFLTEASAASLTALGEFEWSVWDSGNCPVCGAAATMGRMGESTALEGSGRTLWCSHCHAEWEYARIRCARCGSRAQNQLHYTYEESDPVHRLHLCDACHGYLKVTFVDEMRKPIAMVVEEAASVTLDAIARANGYTVTGSDG